MSHAEKCPVCEGSGLPHEGLLLETACHGCGGKGWVEVSGLTASDLDQFTVEQLRARGFCGKITWSSHPSGER